MAITGSMWPLQGLHGNYRVYVAITGSTWPLQGLRGNYRVYVAITGHVELTGRLLYTPRNNHANSIITEKRFR